MYNKILQIELKRSSVIKYISIFLIFVYSILTFNVHAEINSRGLLDEFFVGCASEDQEVFTIGESYEYCGCMTNVLAKTLDTEELFRLSLDLLSETDGMTEDEAEQVALSMILENDAITDGLMSCLVKLYE